MRKLAELTEFEQIALRRRAKTAEWMIACLAGRERAASIVGDLVEAGEDEHAIRFWYAVDGILVALIWRRIVAYGAALVAVYIVYATLPLFWAYGTHHPKHSPPYAWRIVFTVVLMCFVNLVFATLYSAIRFGLRDKLTQIALYFCATSGIGLLWWWVEPVLAISCAISALLLLFSMTASSRRRPMLTLMIALGSGLAGFLLASQIARAFGRLVLHSATNYPLVMRSVTPAAFFLLAAACGWTHHFLLEPSPEDPETS